MSKIKLIKVSNFKAVGHLEADFNGCTAIITAGNEKGKTSFLNGIIDRIRFVRPDIPVKKGETQGTSELELTTGERFIWGFDIEGKDKLVYIDQQAVKQTVTVALGQQFFPPLFDIDKFLQSSPKEQSKQLQKIVGVDFTDIDKRYEAAYRERTARNAEAERFHVKLSKMLVTPKVDPVDLTEVQSKKEAERARLNQLYKENKEYNAKQRGAWEQAKAVIDDECRLHNEKQAQARQQFNAVTDALAVLISAGYTGTEGPEFVLKMGKGIKSDARAIDLYPPEPKYINELPDDRELQKIDTEILAASQVNFEAQKYQEYIDYKQQVEDAQTEAANANQAVKDVEAERARMIAGAQFPEGVQIDPAGNVTVDGFPLDKKQISTSKLYITALRIAAMSLGEVKTLYFDASYLDNKNLEQIQQWAHAHGLQLLIERPDREGGDIRYELIEEH